MAGPIGVDEIEVTLGASIGVTLAGPGEAVDDILNRADQAMYRAKRRPATRSSSRSSADDRVAPSATRRSPRSYRVERAGGGRSGGI